ncbi:MAG: hypothetical protein JSV09_07205 [Thermoplasmata archaeon]|nr:MAG: hypothetical protein JSV09_07205 [Thermoplasmata archaeon]
MEGTEGYGALLYDNARYRARKIRKKREIVQYRNKKMDHLIYSVLLFIIISIIIILMILLDIPVVYILLFGIIMYLLWITFIGTIFLDIKKSHIRASLDVKIFEKAIVMPEWDTVQPAYTKLYPIDVIDKIFWNEGYDHLLFIKSEMGIRISKDRLKHEMLYKNIIDNKKDFRRALRKTGKLIEDEKMDISEWLRKKEVLS